MARSRTMGRRVGWGAVVLSVLFAGGIQVPGEESSTAPLVKTGDSEVVFRVKPSLLSAQDQAAGALPVTPDGFVEVRLPGKMYDSPRPLRVVSRAEALRTTPLDAADAFMSAYLFEDREWVVENFAAQEQPQKQALLQDEETFQSDLAAMRQTRGHVVRGEVRVDDHGLLIYQMALEQPEGWVIHCNMAVFVQEQDGWKHTAAPPADVRLKVAYAAIEKGLFGAPGHPLRACQDERAASLPTLDYNLDASWTLLPLYAPLNEWNARAYEKELKLLFRMRVLDPYDEDPFQYATAEAKAQVSRQGSVVTEGPTMVQYGQRAWWQTRFINTTMAKDVAVSMVNAYAQYGPYLIEASLSGPKQEVDAHWAGIQETLTGLKTAESGSSDTRTRFYIETRRWVDGAPAPVAVQAGERLTGYLLAQKHASERFTDPPRPGGLINAAQELLYTEREMKWGRPAFGGPAPRGFAYRVLDAKELPESVAGESPPFPVKVYEVTVEVAQ